MASPAAPQSAYLVERLRTRNEVNLFDAVKMRLVAAALRRVAPDKPRVLDLGCAGRSATRHLGRLGVEHSYFGVDYEADLGPDLVADLRDPGSIAPHLPWSPDVVFLLDVLEHLDPPEESIERVLDACRSLLAPGAPVVITVPHNYRLDRLKLSHLHYPEHKIRLTHGEWARLIGGRLEILSVHAAGIVSTLPFLVMLSPRYREDNSLGRAFRHLRDRVLDRPSLHRLDGGLCERFGEHPAARFAANDLLFVCRVPGAARG